MFATASLFNQKLCQVNLLILKHIKIFVSFVIIIYYLLFIVNFFVCLFSETSETLYPTHQNLQSHWDWERERHS